MSLCACANPVYNKSLRMHSVNPKAFTMAATTEAYLEPQQLCDYVLLRHVNVGKDVETDKLHKVQQNFTCLRY